MTVWEASTLTRSIYSFGESLQTGLVNLPLTSGGPMLARAVVFMFTHKGVVDKGCLPSRSGAQNDCIVCQLTKVMS